MILVQEIIVFFLCLLWPLFLLAASKIYSQVFKWKALKLVMVSYLGVFLSFTVALFYSGNIYEPYASCIKLEEYNCSVFSSKIIDWYGEWSLVFNNILSLVLVLLTSIKLKRSANEI